MQRVRATSCAVQAPVVACLCMDDVMTSVTVTTAVTNSTAVRSRIVTSSSI